MKDRKNIRKILYVGETNIGLVVFEQDINNVLFASETSIEPSNLKVKILELITNAANFLGFNIKEVEIIFDDSKYTKYSYTNYEFIDCNNEEDIAKEIFKKARIDNYYVNEINFMGIAYDEIEKVAKVNCQICATDYSTYKNYIDVVKSCNLNIIKSTNLYKLLKPNKEQIELTIGIKNNIVTACEYYGNKLNNVKVISIDTISIKQHIADKFSIDIDKVDSVISLANDIATDTDCLETSIVRNYNLKTKTFNEIKTKDFLSLYREELRMQIINNIDVRLFQSVSVISNQPINAIEGFNFIKNDETCFENISIDKFLAITNINVSNEIDQFNFENKIKVINLQI